MPRGDDGHPASPGCSALQAGSAAPARNGRPRKKGERLPSLDERLEDPDTEWQRVDASWWYGHADKKVEIATATGVWYHPGKPVVPLRWVLVRDPDGDLDPKAFLSTDLEARPIDILRWFVRRWSVEVTFEEMRRHLGMETQRQWSDRAILRTTPCLLGLFSLVTLMLVTLMADRLAQTGALDVHRDAWYEGRPPGRLVRKTTSHLQRRTGGRSDPVGERATKTLFRVGATDRDVENTDGLV